MGWKKWTRERLTAAALQEIHDQTVLHFPSASAADAAVAEADRRDGMVRFLEDVERGEWYDADAGAWRWVFGTPAPPTMVPVAGGFYVWKTRYASTDEPLQVSMVGGQVSLTGMVGNSAAYGAATTIIPAGGIPIAFRPAARALRTIRVGPGGVAGLEITTGGAASVLPVGNVAIDTPHYFDVTWNLGNA